MKRSLLYQVGGPDGTDFETLAAEVALAEELGVDTVWCFPSSGDDGSFRGSAPEIWLAGLAERTTRIRLGWGIGELLPPDRPPMRVAEQGAALDLASEGRLEVALLPEGDLAGTWDEGYRMVVDMWDDPTFSWGSERFEVRPIDVVPKPHQKPHPPLWLVGWTDDHARAAGRGGLGYLDVSGANDEAVEIHRDAYAAGRAEASPEDLVSVHAVAVLGDFAPGDAADERLARWAGLGIDHAILRAGPVDGGGETVRQRIRAFTDGAADVH
ncbi:MAG: LLM class flavin-dependent oxidoreductase [Myxococcota bacterium]